MNGQGMIVVSGVQRSGSSLVMRMAQDAGCIIEPGTEKFPLDWEETRTEKGLGDKKGQNDTEIGFWENIRIVDAGANNTTMPQRPQQVQNNFVKIFAPGLPNTSDEYLQKVILNVRNPWSWLHSWRKVFIFNVKINEGIDINDLRYPYMTEWVFKYGNIIFDYLKRKYPMLIVDYDELMEKTNDTCEAIKNFTGFGRWDLAAELVDPSKNRNKKPKRASMEKEEIDGLFNFTDELYRALKKGDLNNDLLNELRKYHQLCAKAINDTNQRVHQERIARAQALQEAKK